PAPRSTDTFRPPEESVRDETGPISIGRFRKQDEFDTFRFQNSASRSFPPPASSSFPPHSPRSAPNFPAPVAQAASPSCASPTRANSSVAHQFLGCFLAVSRFRFYRIMYFLNYFVQS